MSEPIRITCQSEEAVPTGDKIAGLVTDDQHVVLVFPATRPADFDKQSIIERLAHKLPEYSVFDSGDSSQDGSTWITVKAVIPVEEIESYAAEIVAAARLFRERATELMTGLAHVLGAAPEAFTSDPSFWVQFEQSGRLDSEWRYTFHGFECGFGNEITGQHLEVRMGFAGEWGVLDPYFFAEWIKSSPGMEHVSGLFKTATMIASGRLKSLSVGVI